MKHIERIFHKDSRAIGPEWSQQQETIDCCSFQYFQPCQVTRDAKQHCQSYLAKNTLFSICGIVQLGSLNVFSCSEYFKVVVNLGLGIWCHKGLPSSSMGLLSSLSNMGSHNHTHGCLLLNPRAKLQQASALDLLLQQLMTMTVPLAQMMKLKGRVTAVSCQSR